MSSCCCKVAFVRFCHCYRINRQSKIPSVLYSLSSTSSSSLLASESDAIASGPTGGRRKESGY